MLEQVLDRLNDAAKPPLKHVAGASAMAALTDAPPKHLQPAAFVIPVADAAGPNEAATGTTQRLVQRIGVVLALGNLSDRRGEAAAQTAESVREAVRAALVGWQPSAAHTAMTLARGRAVTFDDGVLWWIEEYEAATWMRT